MRTTNVNFTEYLDNCLKTLNFLKAYSKNQNILDNLSAAILYVYSAKENIVEDNQDKQIFFTNHKFCYMIDRIEHGNGGVSGTETLVGLPFEKMLKTTPRQYGVCYKEWGYWPVISLFPDFLDGSNKYIYSWDNDKQKWVEDSE